MKPNIQRHSEDAELNQAKSKPDMVDRPVKTACTNVHHYNSTKYCSRDRALLIFPFLQTNITSQIWPSGGKGGGTIAQHWTYKIISLQPSLLFNVSVFMNPGTGTKMVLNRYTDTCFHFPPMNS